MSGQATAGEADEVTVPPAGEVVGDRRGDPEAESAAPALDQGRPHLGSARFGYTFRRLLVVCDLASIIVAAAITVGLVMLAGRNVDLSSWWLTLAVTIFLWIPVANAFGLYHLAEKQVDHGFVDELGPVFTVASIWLWLFLIARSAVSTVPSELLGPALFWVVLIFTVIFFRMAARFFSRGTSWFRRPVAIIGSEPGIDVIRHRVERHDEWGLDAVAAFSRLADGRFRRSRVGDDGDVDWDSGPGDLSASDLAAIVSEMGVARAIITDTGTDLTARTELLRELVDHRIVVDYVSGGPESLYSTASLHHFEGLPVLSVYPTAPGGVGTGMKRMVDVIGSGLALAILSPLFLVAALAIKLDTRGPVFFRQPRRGISTTSFEVCKFRTMVDGADAMRQDYVEDSIYGDDRLFKLVDDPRVTRVGRILRKWSLDEFPQLWNVLRGDMSLVGPRPLPLNEAAEVPEKFGARFNVRPGITGPWQILGRSDIPFDDMIRLDYTYVVGWSLKEDFLLMLRTITAVLRRKGAY